MSLRRFFVFQESDFGWVEVSEKNSFSTQKRGIIAQYCAVPPSQPPFIAIAYNIAQYIYIFPMTLFIAYCNQILAIYLVSKGQPMCSATRPRPVWWLLKEESLGLSLCLHVQTLLLIFLHRDAVKQE